MSGYTKLAAFVTESHHPILKKYHQLAARDLLYLQAEICELEYKYRIVAQKNACEKDDERQYYDRDWFHLASSSQSGPGGEQWTLALDIREKLREYYAAILQYSQIMSLPQPKPSDRRMLQKWIENPCLGGGCQFLGRDLAGIDQPSVYDSIHQDDLAILSDGYGEDDLITKFVHGPVLSLFHFLWQYKKTPLPIDPERSPTGENRSTLYRYEGRHIIAATNLLGTVLSSIAPLISIVVLSFVGNPKARLGLVCAFTLLFTITLAIVTRARRVEIFAATAAFASVLVVFIGTSSNTI